MNYLENARRSYPQQGWGVFEEDKDTLAEIAGWVTLANISSLESRTKIWSDAERAQMLGRIQRDLTRLVERQDESGGWSPVQVRGEEFTRVYPTLMAVWSLLETKRSESLNELLGNRFDENIKKGIDWLLRAYKEGIGWEPNPHRQSQFERFEGLTAQVLFVLSRAEKYFPDLEQNDKYISAEMAFTDSMDVHRSIGDNKRVPDSDQYIHTPNKTYKLEGSTSLWFPWSFAEPTHLSTDSSLKEKEKMALRLRRDVLGSVFQQLSLYVGSQPPYVLAEFLLCLSNSIDIPPAES